MIDVAITALGKYLPEQRLTNKDLEKMVDTNDEWITTRTGIKERRIANKEDGEVTTYMATKAVEQLIAKRGLDPLEIDLIICGTITPDLRFPDTANAVAHNIGATNAFGFDVNAACSGFLFSLATGVAYIKSGMYKKVIVVGVDTMSSILNYEDRSTCIIFGDGAGATLLEANVEGNGIKDQVLRGDGSGIEFLHMKNGGALNPITKENIDSGDQYVFQDGRPVFKRAVQGMSRTVKQVLANNNLVSSELDWIVPHQANMRIINSVADQLDFPLEKVMQTIENYGNTTAATIPLCLNDYESKLKKGDKIILTAFGGGFTWGSIYLTWAYDGEL